MSAEFLSAADDFLTRLLFDLIIFADPVLERMTGKMNSAAPKMAISLEDVKIVSDIFDDLRDTDMDISDAWELFKEIDSCKKFIRGWKGNERNLELHARRYFSAFVPETGIAFRETDRYTNPTKTVARNYPSPSPTPPPAPSTPSVFLDVAVFATRDFEKGDIVQLKGGLGALTEAEDDALRSDGQRKDFSVIYTSRKNCFSLLLGPSRFVNHDCRNNVKFYQTGKNMSFEVIEDIAADEEIFTDYGSEYFEASNAACLCATCERLQRGAFSAAALVEPLQSGHQITAARNIQPGPKQALKLTSNEELLSTATRRSDRLVEVVDLLRGSDRIVHPQLPPPKGYKRHYRWNLKKNTATFIGPTGAPDSSSEGGSGSSDSDSSSDESSEEEIVKSGRRGKPVERKSVVLNRSEQWVTDEENSEGDSGSSSESSEEEEEFVAPPKKRKFEFEPKKKILLKKIRNIPIVKLFNEEEEYESSSRSTSMGPTRNSSRGSKIDYYEGTPGTPESIDGDIDGEPIDGEPMSPIIPSDIDGKSYDDSDSDSNSDDGGGSDFWLGGEEIESTSFRLTMTRSETPCTSDEEEEFDAEEGGGENINDKPEPLPEKDQGKDDEEMNQLPDSDNGHLGGSGIGGGGQNGSDDKDEKDEKPKKVIDPIAVEDDITELEERIKKEELMEDSDVIPTVHHEDDHEAANYLMLFSQPNFLHPQQAHHQAPSSSTSSCSSDLSDVSSTNSIPTPIDLISTLPKKLETTHTNTTPTTRLSRKKSKTKTTSRPRRSTSPKHSPVAPPPSKPKKGPTSNSSPRSSRSNNPIKDSLSSFLQSSGVRGVTGGYDESSGKYFSDRAASNLIAPTPTSKVDFPKKSSPKKVVKGSNGKGKGVIQSEGSAGKQKVVAKKEEVKQGEKRATRTSLPIKGDLRDLLDSPSVSNAVGGYNSETKKYTARK